MRESVKRGDHIISTHARQQLLKRKLTFFDPERAILTGRIITRQRDEATREWKYVVRGWLTAPARWKWLPNLPGRQGGDNHRLCCLARRKICAAIFARKKVWRLPTLMRYMARATICI
jgi:hypothetical protein